MISIHWEQVNKYLMQYDKHYFEQQEVVRHTIYSLFMNCRIDKKQFKSQYVLISSMISPCLLTYTSRILIRKSQ